MSYLWKEDMKIKLYHLIDDEFLISFEDRIIISNGIGHKKIYSKLKQAWLEHEEFRKYRFPLTAYHKLENGVHHPIYETIDDWRLI